ncbi:MAG: hypothetical protein JXB00_19015 [Bacteroidales bacterium]|nr:hypothetical protein [Bacteroidales bacterium]
MKPLVLFSIGCLYILSSCAPKISSTVSKAYNPLDYREEVKVYGLQDPVPADAEELGIVKIGDTGFSVNCNLEMVIYNAQMEARKIGGNAIKIISHKIPSAMGSSCHRISAKILKIDNRVHDNELDITQTDENKEDYALLHVYRFAGVGALVNYDLFLGDSVICRVSNNRKETIKIKKDGMNTLWAKTEVKYEIPVNIKFGNEYYLRCGITMGAFVGHPRLELVDKQIGRFEFESVKTKSTDKDLIILHDGRKVECIITGEDDDNVFFKTIYDDREVETHIKKSKIREIQKVE